MSKSTKRKLSNSGYWEWRAARRVEQYEKTARNISSKVQGAYDKALTDIKDDINRIFSTFKRDGSLTDEEASTLLNRRQTQNELQELKKNINKISDPQIRRKTISQINSPAYAYRIGRLEALRNNITTNIHLLADIETKSDTAGFKHIIKDTYNRTQFDIAQGVGFAFTFDEMNNNKVSEILKHKWSGKHYSTRIWNNTDVLAQNVEKIITSGAMTGRSYRDMASDLQEVMNSSKYAAERIIRTEANAMANAAEIEAYKRDGIEWFKYSATLDSRTSKICADMDGKKFEVKNARQGKNVPPLHPNCRSTTIPAIDDDVMDHLRTRIARDPVTGENYYIPADMEYNEWRAVQVDQSVVNPVIGNTVELKDINTLEGLSLFAKEKWNVNEVNISGLDPKAIKGTFEVMDEALNEFPQIKGFLERISQSDSGMMSVLPWADFRGAAIFFNPEYYGNIEDIMREYSLSLEHFDSPIGTDWRSVGVHEIGHVINALIIKQHKSTPSEALQDWTMSETARMITNKALNNLLDEFPSLANTKKFLIKRGVSGYAQMGGSVELLAEAFSDYMANRENANKLSLQIMKELKKWLKK